MPRSRAGKQLKRPTGKCSMVGSMRSNRGEVTHLPARLGGIQLRFAKDGKVQGRTPANRDGLFVDTLEYSGQLDEFGTLALIEEHNGKVCRLAASLQ